MIRNSQHYCLFTFQSILHKPNEAPAQIQPGGPQPQPIPGPQGPMGGGPAAGPPGHPGPFPGPGPDMGREPRGPPPHEMRGPPDQWGKKYLFLFA